MAQQRRRTKVSVSVDPRLLDIVDAYVEAHPQLDRGRVFDEALSLWYHALLDEASAERLAVPERLVGMVEPRDWREGVDPAVLAEADRRY